MAEEVRNEFDGTAHGMVVQAHTVNLHGADPAPDGRPRRIDFSGYEEQKREGFTGRRWLFEEIDTWLTGGDERVLLITGPPGIGKSAFLAELAVRSGDHPPLARYFCTTEDGTTLEQAAFVGHLAAELAAALPEYARIAADDGWAQLDRSAIARDPGHALDQGVIAPLRRLPEPPEDSRPRVILIDGLDESLAGHALRESVLGLLAPRIQRFPRWIRFVLASRPAQRVLTSLGTARVLPIEPEQSRNLADVLAIIDRHLGGPTWPARLREQQLTADEAALRIRRAARGNPLYATMLLKSVELGRTSLSDGELPPGLAGAYELFLDRHFRDAQSYAAARPVLEAVVAAAEPLPLGVIEAVSGLEASYRLSAVLRELSPLLPERHGRHSFFHQSMAEWLASPDHPYHAAPAAGRRRLSRGFLDYLRSPGSGPVDHRHMSDPTARYWVHHGLDHLAASGDVLPAGAEAGAFAPVALAGQDHIWAFGAFTKYGVPTRMRRYVEGLLHRDGFEDVRNLLALLRGAVKAYCLKAGVIQETARTEGSARYLITGSARDGSSLMAALMITGFAGAVFRAAKDSRELALDTEQLAALADELRFGRYVAGGVGWGCWAVGLGSGEGFLTDTGDFLYHELHQLMGD
ncbi:AAA family ATPase [Kitasatospora sp. NPDC058162]|uniref:AAA family ATPase n=1 Tax=Kitasatospora sp. NPDC058162 TaxID=3346362 RepID=UPI0036DBBD90